MFTFDLWAMFRAKQEEGRWRPFGSIGIFFLALLVTLGRDVIFHLPVIASFVTFCHLFKLGLFLGRHSLPSLGALLGELGEVDRGIGVFLLVLLPAGLHEEGVRGHLAPRLVGVALPHGAAAPATTRPPGGRARPGAGGRPGGAASRPKAPRPSARAATPREAPPP